MNRHLLEMGKDIQEEVLKLREEGQKSGGIAIKIYTYIGRLEDVNYALEDKLHRRNMQIKDLKEQNQRLKELLTQTEKKLIDLKIYTNIHKW